MQTLLMGAFTSKIISSSVVGAVLCRAGHTHAGKVMGIVLS
ncbi:hypothetical protein [Endozoicomonas numazuensis]|nr:hypothetical protein [Endozoicomonas numazuensis]